jgi:hypothetical protein
MIAKVIILVYISAGTLQYMRRKQTQDSTRYFEQAMLAFQRRYGTTFDE